MAYAAEIYVPDNFTTIGEAIEAAQRGDSIFVGPNTYNENLYIDKNITIQSTMGEAFTLINGSWNGNCIVVNSSIVNIQGFTIINSGNNTDESGIYVHEGSDCVFQDLIINHTRNAFVIKNSEMITIFDCLLKENLWGICLEDSSKVLVNNTNIAVRESGIYNYHALNVNITDCRISNCINGVHIFASEKVRIKDSIIVDNRGNGVWVGGTWGEMPLVYTEGHEFIDSKISGNSWGISTWFMGSSIIRNCNFTNNRENGILFQHSGENSIYDSSITNNSNAGIHLHNSSNIIIMNNFCEKNNNSGIDVDKSLDIKILNNTIFNNNGNGIHYDYCKYMNISDNNINRNLRGIDASYGMNCTINNNHIKDSINDGMIAYSENNMNITNNVISGGNWEGLVISNCNYTYVFNNFVSNCSRYGLRLYYTNYCLLKNNHMENNEYNFAIFGYPKKEYIHDIDTSNTIENKKVYYYREAQDLIISPHNHPDLGFLAVINSDNVTVKGLDLTHNGDGLTFAYSNNSHIDDVDISQNRYGIWLQGCKSCSISNSDIVRNALDGVFISSSKYVEVHGNNINENSLGYELNGVHVINSEDVLILDNNVNDNNYIGVRVCDSANCIVNSNKCNNNGHAGIFFENSAGEVSENNCTGNNASGIEIYWDSWAYVQGNEASYNNHSGIWVVESEVDLKDNVVCHNNWDGVFIEDSVANLTGNQVTFNDQTGVGVQYSEIPCFILNTLYNNRGDGLGALDSQLFNVTKNIILNNTNNGVWLGQSIFMFTLNNVSSNGWSGLFLENSEGLIIHNNFTSNGWEGVSLFGSDNNVIKNCTICLQESGIGLWDGSDNNVIYSNLIKNNQYDGVSSDDSNNNSIRENQCYGNGVGIATLNSIRNKILENNCSNNRWTGIEIVTSRDSIVKDNYVFNNSIYGLRLVTDSCSNFILDNVLRRNHDFGVVLDFYSDENWIIGNTITDSNEGVHFFQGFDNLLTHNEISYNDHGITLLNLTGSNIIAFNNFQSNLNQLVDVTPLSNTWDIEGRGNYWDDYYGLDTNSDGVGDTDIPHHNVDNYPLMNEVAKPSNDLAVHVSLPEEMYVGEHVEGLITVLNLGNTTEYDVELTSYMNGSKTTLNIPEMPAKSFYHDDISGTPTPGQEGTFNITCRVKSQSVDYNTWNNVATKMVHIHTAEPKIEPITGDSAYYSVYLSNSTYEGYIGDLQINYNDYWDPIHIWVEEIWDTPFDRSTKDYDVNIMTRLTSYDDYFHGWFETDVGLGDFVAIVDREAEIVSEDSIQVDSWAVNCWKLDVGYLDQLYGDLTIWFDKQSGVTVRIHIHNQEGYMNYTLEHTNIMENHGDMPLLRSIWLENQVTIDGIFSSVDEWNESSSTEIELIIPGNLKTIKTKTYSKNDHEWLYLMSVIEWPQLKLDYFDAFIISYMWGHNLTQREYSDIGVCRVNGEELDGYGWNGTHWHWDTLATPAGSIDIVGEGSWNGTHYIFELKKKLDSSDGYDWTLVGGETYGMWDEHPYLGGCLGYILRDESENEGYYRWLRIYVVPQPVEYIELEGQTVIISENPFFDEYILAEGVTWNETDWYHSDFITLPGWQGEFGWNLNKEYPGGNRINSTVVIHPHNLTSPNWINQTVKIPTSIQSVLKARICNPTGYWEKGSNYDNVFVIKVKDLETHTVEELFHDYLSYDMGWQELALNITKYVGHEVSISIEGHAGGVNSNWNGEFGAIDYFYVESQAEKMDYTLNHGWNLMGVSLFNPCTGIHEFMKNETANIECVFGYDNDTNKFTYWFNGVPKQYNTLHELKHRHGYWLKTNTQFNLTRLGVSYNKTVTQCIGWNLFSIEGMEPLAVQDFVDSTPEDEQYIYGYYDNKWLSWIKGVGGTLDYLEPCKGYWIYIE